MRFKKYAKEHSLASLWFPMLWIIFGRASNPFSRVVWTCRCGGTSKPSLFKAGTTFRLKAWRTKVWDEGLAGCSDNQEAHSSVNEVLMMVKGQGYLEPSGCRLEGQSEMEKRRRIHMLTN